MLIKLDARRMGKTTGHYHAMQIMVDDRLDRGQQAQIVIHTSVQVSVITHFIDPVSKLAYATEMVLAS